MTHPRALIVVERDAAVTVIEDHVALGDTASFTNPVTEFVLGDGAVGRHYHLGRGSERAYRISTLHVEQGARTDFASHSVLLGGALVRHNVFPTLRGDHGESLLNGLYCRAARSTTTRGCACAPREGNCHSRQLPRHPDDKAKAMFTGDHRDRGAQKRMPCSRTRICCSPTTRSWRRSRSSRSTPTT
jgi:Fe-S cluster assembly protein SufD